jgi:hypothetical protein
MKILPLMVLSLAVGSWSVPNVVSAQDNKYDRRYERNDNRWERRNNSRVDRRDLEGTWYLDGHRDRAAKIVQTRQGLEAINEKGDSSRLALNRNGDVEALDWEGGLKGNVRRDRIEWENGTTWVREGFRTSAR